jgi:Ca2+-transporting ATPase
MQRTGAVLSPDEAPLGEPDPDIALLVAGGALCNDATLEPDEDEMGGYHTVGDPTEGALVVAAARMGMWKSRLDDIMPRVGEVPFESARKRMSTVHERPSEEDREGEEGLQWLPQLPKSSYVVFAKGSADSLLEISDRVWNNGEIEALDDEWHQRIEGANDDLAEKGIRVLGVAVKVLDTLPDEVTESTIEHDLIFVGLAGMIDPPRPEVHEAVEECRTAGIRPVMITGDHPLTALNIAQDLEIERQGGRDRVLTGRNLARMDLEELEDVVEEIPVYARVNPEDKVKIVEALKNRGHFVAMTGDGVNDAPALKRADIGVAMGITGTDVSKEASEMILLDDNFATIVNAIEEGRTIYENIRKFVRYIISSNVGEIFIMLMAPLLGLPVPLTALQLLWINLVTDGLPALALGIEPAGPDIMERPPHPPDESVLARGLGAYIAWVGLLLGLVCLTVDILAQSMPGDVWQTMVFTTLGLAQMGNALAVRSDRESLFTLGLLSNKALLGSVILTFLLQLAVVYIPFMQTVFETEPLTLAQLGISLAFSSVIFVAVEIVKLIKRRSDADS